MYHVMLVDDDLTMRVKLKNLIQWDKMNCVITGESSNGTEAISMLQKKQPDILITDIYMPGANGIDLIQYVKKRYPHIFILALSAYDDFFYVRDSLKFGAFDYVLKHQLTASKLKESLNEAFEVIQKKPKQEGRDVEKISHVITNLLETPGSRGKSIIYPVTGGLFILAAGSVNGIKDFNKIDRKKSRYIESLITETLRLYDWESYWEVYSGLPLILFQIDHIRSYQDIQDILELIGRNVERFTGIKIHFSSSEVFQNIIEIGKIYKKLLKRIDNQEYSIKPDNFGVLLQTQEIKRIEEMLLLGDDNVLKYLGNILNRFPKENGISSVQKNMATVELCSLLKRAVEREEQRDEAKETLRMKIDDTLLNLQADRVQEYEKSIIDLYKIFMETKKVDQISVVSNDLVNKSIQYIYQNYNKNFSLQDIADALSINSAYLCRLFKRHTGKTIVTYINDVKMEKADQLLKEGKMSLKEISYSVGFQNYSYFYQLFKNYYGEAPSERNKK